MKSRQTLKLGELDTMYEPCFPNFRASDNVVPIQPGDRSNVEETSSFIAVFTLHKMFKSIARYVNAAIKQNPR